MKILQKVNRMIYCMGYLFVAAAINIILVETLPNYSETINFWPVYVILIIGLLIMGITLFKFSDVERLKILLVDLIFIAIFIIFGVIDLPQGSNFVIGSISGTTFFYYFIYKQYLFYLE